MSKDDIQNVVVPTRDESFQSDVIDSELPSLVLFTAEWSGPSKVMLPLVETTCRKFKGKINSFHAKGEETKSTMAKFGIRVAPTLAIFKGGKLIGVRVNRISEQQIVTFIDAIL